jgi:uncharacterized protein (DUF2062 family)
LRYFWHHYLWNSRESAARRATALGVGVFCSISPAWGVHNLMALMLARFFQLNRVLAVAASNLSLPPLIPVVVYACLVAGHFVFTGQWVWTLPLVGLKLAMAQNYLKEFLAGSCLLAMLAGALTWGVSYFFLALFLQPQVKA